MFLLSLAITLLFGYFIPIWMFGINWISLTKLSFQIGGTDDINELILKYLINPKTALRYLITSIFICILIFIITMCITNLIKKVLNKNKYNGTSSNIDKYNDEIKKLQMQKARLIIYGILTISAIIWIISSLITYKKTKIGDAFLIALTFAAPVGIIALIATIIVIFKIKAQKQICKNLKEYNNEQQYNTK